MVYVFLANGFEIVEAMTPVDIMKRAGIEVKTVSITDDQVVESSNKTKVFADTILADVDLDKAQMLVLPGGMPGSDNLAACRPLVEKLISFNEQDKAVAAICAAPYVLGVNGILKGKKATCFTGFEERLIGAECTGEKAVISGNVITARGMGASIEFGLAIVEYLKGKKEAERIAQKILF